MTHNEQCRLQREQSAYLFLQCPRAALCLSDLGAGLLGSLTRGGFCFLDPALRIRRHRLLLIIRIRNQLRALPGERAAARHKRLKPACNLVLPFGPGLHGGIVRSATARKYGGQCLYLLLQLQYALTNILRRGSDVAVGVAMHYISDGLELAIDVGCHGGPTLQLGALCIDTLAQPRRLSLQLCDLLVPRTQLRSGLLQLALRRCDGLRELCAGLCHLALLGQQLLPLILGVARSLQ